MSRVPWQLFLPLALALLVLLAPERAQAGKYSWPGWKLEDREYAWAREAIYLRKDAPAAVSNDRSYIDLQLRLEGVEGDSSNWADIVVYHSQKSSKVGRGSKLCCSQGYYNRKPQHCPAGPDRIALKNYPVQLPNSTRDPWSHLYWRPQQFSGRVPVAGGRISYRFNYNHRFEDGQEIDKSGVWYVVIGNCNKSSAFKVRGDTDFRNPYGWLDGEHYPLLAFWIVIVIVWLGIGLVWVILMARFHKHLQPVQYGFGVVMVIALIESIMWMSVYAAQNDLGDISAAGPALSAIVSSAKNTLSHFLILTVALGYRIWRKQLVSSWWMFGVLLLFVIAHFISGCIGFTLLAVDNWSVVWVPDAAILVFLIPYIMLEVTFFVLILWNLFYSMMACSMKKLRDRWFIYRNLLFVVIAGGIVAGIFGILQLALLGSGERDRAWDWWWLFSIFYEVIYIVIFVASAIVWRPNKNNKRYAYTTVAADPSSGEGGDRELAEVPTDSETPDGPSPAQRAKEISEAVDVLRGAGPSPALEPALPRDPDAPPPIVIPADR